MKRLVLISTLLATLAGCAGHQPSHLALSPMVPSINQQTTATKDIAIQTFDARKANYIVKFANGDDAARLISPSEPTRAIVDNLFKQAFVKAGYQLNSDSNDRMQLHITQLLTTVNESMFSFDANSVISIQVTATNDRHTFTKQYSIKGNLKGPFSADFAQLELELNKLISKLTGEIVNDAELNQFLAQR